MNANSENRRAGITLLELSFTMAAMLVLLGSVSMFFRALSSGTASPELAPLAQVENDRAFIRLMNDLQVTDTTGKDSSGNPYFQIVDHGGGEQNSIIFRNVEGFPVDPDQDRGAARFGKPIQYFVNPNGQLIRSQDGSMEVAANRISGILFAGSDDGRITVEITSYAGQGEGRMEYTNRLVLTPRKARNL